MSRRTEAAQPTAEAHTGHELEIRQEFKDVVRVVAMQIATSGELIGSMFPTADEIQALFSRPMSREMAMNIFNYLSSPTPDLTRMIWELKEGGISDGNYILAGGKVDIDSPNHRDIILAALRELEEETGHETRRGRLREDCTRLYGFNKLEGTTLTQRMNREHLVVAYIPRRQNTVFRFEKNEKIKLTQRFTIEQVSHLLHDEVHISSEHPGVLIDNLCLNTHRHAEYGVILDLEETQRTRTAIETEMRIYEASMWKRLALALLKKQPNKVRGTFRTEMHSIMTTEDPTDIDSATILMGSIRKLLPKIEPHCTLSNSRKKQIRKEDHIQILLHAGIPEELIFKRLALIQQIELAYKDAFHTKKH